MRIDSHQHFWIYNAQRDGWITDAMRAIQRNFIPEDLAPLLAQHKFQGCVAVQADQSMDETDFLIQLAERNAIIRGVVGWVDLCAPGLPEKLQHYKHKPIVKGFRHVLQAEPEAFFRNNAFIDGVKTLAAYNFTYDILIKAHQLNATIELINHLPDQKLVIDHLAKPAIGKDRTEWTHFIKTVAQNPHIYCKLSGLVTEADWHHWTPAGFTPYLETVINEFGTNRVMFGSDWPVCLLAASYQQQLQVLEDFIQPFSETEKQNIMGANAIRFYNL
ncbi:MAG: amidohydrolase family protein [Cytophagales bacterium]|nr:amidohydrolase family protein [Cytophagales bacterium]